MSNQRNPFSRLSDPERATFWAGPTKIKDTISKALGSMVEGDFRCVVLSGEYGSGKSHTLRYFEHQLENRSSSKDLCKTVYVENPGESTVDLYRQFIAKIGYSQVEELREVQCHSNFSRMYKENVLRIYRS